MSFLVGVTGGIGSGKSTVSRFWASYAQLPLVDIDLICRQLLDPGESGWEVLKQEIDGSFFTRSGQLNRRMLREAIFADADLRKMVDSLIHPLALKGMQDVLAAISARMVIVDVPLLYEAGWQYLFDRCVVVYAGHCTCCRRIAARDGISLAEANTTIRSQVKLADKALRADHVINNSGSPLSFMLEVIYLSRYGLGKD